MKVNVRYVRLVIDSEVHGTKSYGGALHKGHTNQIIFVAHEICLDISH